jgi:hypothetical protein
MDGIGIVAIGDIGDTEEPAKLAVIGARPDI